MKPQIALDGRTALVTGASRGLGKAIAIKLAEAGANVALVSHQDKNDLDATAHEVERAGVKAITVLGDVSSPSDVERIFREVEKRFKTLDILINNAGFSAKQSWGSDISKLSLEDFDRTLQVDVRGTFLMCKSAYPLLLKGTGAAIINMTSGAAVMGDPVVLLYAAAKGGVHGLTKALATAWAPKIRVNAIGPGAIRTGWIETWKVPAEDIRSLEELIPAKRLGLPNDIANAALFLSSDLSSYMTGQTIIVDGGVLKT